MSAQADVRLPISADEVRVETGFFRLDSRTRCASSATAGTRKACIGCIAALTLNLKRCAKRRIPPRERQPLDAPAVHNEMWGVDFMSYMIYSETCFRTLNVLDEGNREALAVEVALSQPATRVTQVLDQLVALHGAQLLHIQPGKPNHDA